MQKFLLIVQPLHQAQKKDLSMRMLFLCLQNSQLSFEAQGCIDALTLRFLALGTAGPTMSPSSSASSCIVPKAPAE